MGKCVVLTADADASERRRLTELLRDNLPDDVEVADRLDDRPNGWEHLVVVVRVTPAALADDGLTELFGHFADRVTVIPIVDDRTTFDFGALNGDWAPMLNINAIDLSEEQRLLDGVKIGLGLQPGPMDRSVFLSYRRSDGLEIAQQLQAWLEADGFTVFRDETGLAAGNKAQDEIMRQLQRADFALLLCTPDLSSSQWVTAELEEILSRRIPLRAVMVGAKLPVLAGHPPTIAWEPDREQMQARVRAFVNAGVGSRDVFRTKVRRIIERTADELGLQHWEFGQDRALMIKAANTQALVVWQQRTPSLESLYAIHKTKGHPSLSGFSQLKTFLCSEARSERMTRTAATWAGKPHEICPVRLSELEIKLRTLQ